MKSTPFTDKHIALGAKMAEFAGYNMPISYSGINDEHAAVRRNAGVFDVSHMGEFIIKGEHALDLIQRVTSNDATKLTNGKAQYSCFPNENGGIIDDLLVYCIEENKVYMLVVNAGNIEKDWNWISKHNTKNAEMHNISEKTCLLAVQGPNATKILQSLTEIDILNLKSPFTILSVNVSKGFISVIFDVKYLVFIRCFPFQVTVSSLFTRPDVMPPTASSFTCSIEIL